MRDVWSSGAAVLLNNSSRRPGGSLRLGYQPPNPHLHIHPLHLWLSRPLKGLRSQVWGASVGVAGQPPPLKNLIKFTDWTQQSVMLRPQFDCSLHLIIIKVFVVHRPASVVSAAQGTELTSYESSGSVSSVLHVSLWWCKRVYFSLFCSVYVHNVNDIQKVV